MSKHAVAGVLLFLLVIGLARCGSDGEKDESADSAAPTATEPSAAAVTIPDGAVRVTNRDKGGSGKYEFDPPKLTFKAGEEVTLALTAETEFHTFTVDELGIDVSMDAGQTKISTYKFDKPGTYKLYCIPHQSLGMVGEIVVQ